MQPYNYAIPQANLGQNLLSGLKAGAVLGEMDQASQKRQQHEQFLLDFKSTFEDPSHDKIASLITKHPTMGAKIKESYDLLSAPQRKREIQATQKVYSALSNGRQDIAIEMLDEKILAHDNSGEDSTDLKNIKSMIERDPKTATSFIGMSLASMMGEKDFSKTFKALTEKPKAVGSWQVLNTNEKKDLGLPQKGAFQIDEEGKISQIGGKGVSVTIEGAKQFGTIPKGWQMEEVEGVTKMSPVPGGPADIKAKELVEKKKLGKGVAGRAAGVVFEDIGRLKSKIEKAPWHSPITGTVAELLPRFVAQDRVDAEALTETISANIGFDRLQQMREASPTGGALGAVSERELSNLQAVLGSIKLAQSDKQVLKNLDRLNAIYKNILKKAEAYPDADEFGFGTLEVIETRVTPDGKTIVKYSDGSFEMK